MRDGPPVHHHEQGCPPFVVFEGSAQPAPTLYHSSHPATTALFFITLTRDDRHRQPSPPVRQCPQIGAARSVPVPRNGPAVRSKSHRNCSSEDDKLVMNSRTETGGRAQKLPLTY